MGLLVALANPMHLWMPDMAHMAMLGGAVVIFGIFAAFVLRESAADEREGTHRMFAGRAAFLAGTASLLLGIVYESYYDTLDTWLVAVLVIMVVTKIAARLYSDYKY